MIQLPPEKDKNVWRNLKKNGMILIILCTLLTIFGMIGLYIQGDNL